jgi:hypothetical protein
MVPSALQGRLRPTVIGLSIAVAIPCLFSALAAGWGLPGVVATGLCPPAPLDIPAYPCSPSDYLLRMTVGPWALAGHLFIWCAWAGMAATALFILHFYLRPRRAAGSTTIPEPPTPENLRRTE